LSPPPTPTHPPPHTHTHTQTAETKPHAAYSLLVCLLYVFLRDRRSFLPLFYRRCVAYGAGASSFWPKFSILALFGAFRGKNKNLFLEIFSTLTLKIHAAHAAKILRKSEKNIFYS
jgi:hypothetical protein